MTKPLPTLKVDCTKYIDTLNINFTIHNSMMTNALYLQ